MLFPSWRLWYQNLASNEQGNKNIEAFTNTLSSEDTLVQKVRTLTEDVDTILSSNPRQTNQRLPQPEEPRRNTRSANRQDCVSHGNGCFGNWSSLE